MEHFHDARFLHMVDACHEFYADIPWISADEILSQRDPRSWMIVDVRTEAERAVSIIPGAVSLGDYEAQREAFKGDPVLVYCTVGCRSAGVTQTLHEQGVEAYNLWGGVVDWALHGGPFVTQAGMPTYEVHTHGRRWHLLPPPYVAVW